MQESLIYVENARISLNSNATVRVAPSQVYVGLPKRSGAGLDWCELYCGIGAISNGTNCFHSYGDVATCKFVNRNRFDMKADSGSNLRDRGTLAQRFLPRCPSRNYSPAHLGAKQSIRVHGERREQNVGQIKLLVYSEWSGIFLERKYPVKVTVRLQAAET
ncbi:hypothetical protein GEV33_015261 [Tenebrio molitor]|uniref:Uncharacterized protein n=1 Tax=Tenebrio molitor TaxID=7067 RepID=A0A8J6L437_TENMO|nr:hypothetical protein GEV33_015261 [Tenebrio molitor]